MGNEPLSETERNILSDLSIELVQKAQSTNRSIRPGDVLSKLRLKSNDEVRAMILLYKSQKKESAIKRLEQANRELEKWS